MLKIKDNVDLKELEKFGFKYHKKQRNQYEYYSFISTEALLIVIYNDRKIFFLDKAGLDILFDLIQAGLVEKVGGV